VLKYNKIRESTVIFAFVAACYSATCFNAYIPQAHGSFKAVLLLSLLFSVSPSRARSTGTDAGMSSVLLTMIRFPEC